MRHWCVVLSHKHCFFFCFFLAKAGIKKEFWGRQLLMLIYIIDARLRITCEKFDFFPRDEEKINFSVLIWRSRSERDNNNTVLP